MPHPSRWARLRPCYAMGASRSGSVGGLRRGAWYPVVSEQPPAWTVLQLRRQELVVPSELLQTRVDPPREFSVVRLRARDPNPARGTPDDLGSWYAVCPRSLDRVRLAGHPIELECPRCGSRYPVAWSPLC